MKKRVGIAGGTGYAGQQLLWLLMRHRKVDIDFVSSHSHGGEEVSDIYGNYLDYLSMKCISNEEVGERLEEIDLLFLALPHGRSRELAEIAMGRGIKVVDLGSDFRLEKEEDYKIWYGEAGKRSERCRGTYGLAEIRRDEIRGSNLIANPGCYPTATLLGLNPLLKYNLIEKDSIVVDAKSGVSGAGRSSNIQTLLCECSESIKPYGVTSHRHTPEIEQEGSRIAGDEVRVLFTPHLVPMKRGLLSVIYGRLKGDISEDEIREIYEREYGGEKFIRLREAPPETRWVNGSNYCDISLKVDKRTGRVVVMSVIDNLMKGAAGQAVQNMNIIFGFKEDEGLDFAGIYP